MRGPLLVVLALLTAGCLGGTQDPVTTSNDDGAGQEAWVPDPAWPQPSGESARDLIESYVMTHPYRVEHPAFITFMEKARVDLAALLEGYGHNVTMHVYDGGTNIVAVQPGTTHPDQWVVLSAHYDTVGVGTGTTVYGAWDDGAGVAVLLELARTLGQWEFPFTVAYAFFDGEEKGLVGSAKFVEEYTLRDDLMLAANINTDPPGLNWPCGDQLGAFPVKVITESDKVEEGLPTYTWLEEALTVALDEVGVPSEVVDRTPGIPVASVAGEGLRGGSDHVSFGRVDVANAFVGGTPTTIVNGDADEHTAAAMTYGLHTPLDTLQQMEARCTVGSLAQGLQTTVDLFKHAVSHMAAAGVPAAS